MAELELDIDECGISNEEFLHLISNIDDEIEILIEDEYLDFDFSGFEEEFVLEDIPSIPQHQFREEVQDHQDVVSEDISTVQSSSEILFECVKCKKKYKRQSYYNKHIAACGKDKDLSADEALPKKVKLISEELCDNLISKGPEIFQRVLSLAVIDVAFNIEVKGYKTVGNKVVDLAKSLEKNVSYLDNAKDFISTLLEEFLPILQMDSSKAVFRDKQCTKMHQLSQNLELKAEWLKTLVQFHILPNAQETNVLYIFVIKTFYLQCIEWRNSVLLSSFDKTIDIKLSKEEEKTLRYVAGFIPFSLAKKYGRVNSPVAKAVMQVIGTWCASKDERNSAVTFLEYTNSWIDRINRGGLFAVNDDFYIFIRRVENVARTVLNNQLIVKYKGEDLREVLMQKMSDSKLIDISWTSLTRNLENKPLAHVLKELVLRKWIGLRARAFVNAWVQLVKRKHTAVGREISEKAQPSLRKQLHVSKSAQKQLSES